jgi:distribution and morphology protein 32
MFKGLCGIARISPQNLRQATSFRTMLTKTNIIKPVQIRKISQLIIINKYQLNISYQIRNKRYEFNQINKFAPGMLIQKRLYSQDQTPPKINHNDNANGNAKNAKDSGNNNNNTNNNNNEMINKVINEEKKSEKLGYGARLKYFLLRQNRPFNIDEFTAFFSWILMGNFLWILIGTTTFFGFIIYIVNWIGDGEVERLILKKLITFDNKLNVDLNDPKFKATWEDGRIKIRNLKISSNSGKLHSNYLFEISEINLTFSFNKWFDGQGLIDSIEIDGLQGDVNIFDNGQLILDDSFNDNYQLNHLKVKHSKIRFHSETYFNQPLELVVFNCDLKRLRRKWMVYDFLNADTMFGSLGGSLFTLHKRQHRFAHFNGMDLHDESDDFNNIKLNLNNNRNKGKFNNNTSNNDDMINDNKDMMYNKDDQNNDLWKKITRLRIDMLDLSFFNNENSKLNWIESGKAEVIFDIMLPNDDDDNSNFGKQNLSEDLNFEFSIDGFKRMCDTIYKKLTDNYDDEEFNKKIELNKYVVIDMKINCYDLVAKFPTKLPCSSLTQLPYITSQDLQSLVTFINDEKFGLSSSRFGKISTGFENEENPFDGSEIDNDENINNNNPSSESEKQGLQQQQYNHKMNDLNTNFSNSNNNNSSNELNNNNNNNNDNDDDDHTTTYKMLPPIKFRIIQNLNDFEYLDLPSLLSFTSMPKPDENCDPKLQISFVNTNKFIDSSIVEVLALLLIYKEEIQTRLIDMYSRRSGFEILFNNFILGNLILVGLGSFVI